MGPQWKGLAGHEFTLGREIAQAHLFNSLLGGATFSREVLNLKQV